MKFKEHILVFDRSPAQNSDNIFCISSPTYHTNRK